MRSSYAIGHGSPLLRTPNHRRRATWRRLAVIAAIVGLALASGVIGLLIPPAARPANEPATGPFSYFPSE